MRYRIYVLLFLITATQIVFAQDPQFSQFYANPLYTNPAFAGASGNYRVVLSARDQYTALQNNFKTGAGSFDAPVSTLGGGLGVLATADVSGDGFLTTTSYSGIYSYQINVNRKFTMRAGIQASYVQKSYDFTKFHFGDQIDDRYGFINPTREAAGATQISFPNFGAGILGYTDIFYFGAAIHNITQPNQSFYYPNSGEEQFKLPRRYTVHGGLNVYLTHERNEQMRLMISPNIIYMQQRDYNQLNLGLYLKKQALITGLWFRQTSRNSDAAIVLVGLKFPKFRVGYSYDITVSGARTATQGSHELSLSFEFAVKKHQKRTFKPIHCPVF